MQNFTKKQNHQESQGVVSIPAQDNIDPRFQAQSDGQNQQIPQKVESTSLFQHFRRSKYGQQTQRIKHPRIHFIGSHRAQLVHEEDSSHHIMIKKKSPKKQSNSLIKNILAFVDSRTSHGNDKYGQQWVKEQQRRQEYCLVKGKKRKYVHPQYHRQNQVIYIEPSLSQQEIRQIKKEGKQFVDNNFPPNDISLQGQGRKDPNWDIIKWKKAAKNYPQVKIFVDKIQPYDIKQGFLGDCYFLAGVAAIAQRPDRIIDLFLLKKRNQINYYSIKIIYKGKWRTIDLDDQVPAIYKKPAFGFSVMNELWVILLEKAWAKLYGSYKQIQAGFPQQPLHDLTGAPIKHIFMKNALNNHKIKQQNWDYLIKASQLQYSMVASSNPGSDTNMSPSGIAQGHAYTFLNATTIKLGAYQDRIVQMRNPWGKGQFKGRWSDFDTNWNYVSQEQKKRLHWSNNKDDGLFFMTYDDFIREFRNITIAEIDDNASYVYKSYFDPEGKGAFFRVDITHEGNYSFQVDKTPQRTFTGDKQNRYQYPQTWFQFGKLQQNAVKKYQGSVDRRRTLFRKQFLYPGTYIVWVNIIFDPEFEKDFQVTLAIYAQYCCQIKLATNQQAARLKNRQVTNWDGLMRRKSNQFQVNRPKSNAGISGLQILTKPKIEQPTKEQKSQNSLKNDKVQNNSSAKKSQKTQKQSINTKGSRKVKKVRKIQYHTSTVQITKENPQGQKVIKTQTCQNKKQTLKQYGQGVGITKKIKQQEKIVKQVQNQYQGQTINKVQNFQQKLTCTFEKPDGQIIKKVDRKEGKIQTLQQEGDQSQFGELINSDISVKSAKEEVIELKNQSEIQKEVKQLDLSQSESLTSEEQNNKYEAWKNQMQGTQQFKQRNVVYLQSSDIEMQKYDPNI